MDLGLAGKRALVAGSSSGLGCAAARQLALEGAILALNGRDPERLESAADRLRAELGPDASDQVVALSADVSSTDGAERLVAEAAAHLGGLDILITNAGGPPTGRFDAMDEAAWSEAYELTLMSAVRMIQASLPHLRASEAGSVLAVTSISAKQPIAGLLLSNVMRPAVTGMIKTLSQELAPDGIRANAIMPGWTATERVVHIFEDRAAESGRSVAEEQSAVTSSIPLGRMADPEEFGRVAAFLSSPAASYITGTMLQVDGGSCAGLL